MRTIAVVKPCSDKEKNHILSAVDSSDKVLFFDDEQALLESSEINNIEIVLGEPELRTVSKMDKLRWIQMSWAGANKYTSSKEMFEKICLTSASGAYGHVISEYIISGILALYRNLFEYRKDMKEGKWNWIEDEETLEGKRVLILGTGDIGLETAKKLKCFGTVNVGMSRSGKTNNPAFDEMYKIDSLSQQLPLADVIIIAMPGTKETAGMFDKDKFLSMKQGAMFVNIGRGFIVKTDALTEALINKKIKGAVIDVADPEPLPKDHMLRNMDNVVLTPHISGIGWGSNEYTRNRILDIFCSNIVRDSKGERLENIIDFNTGY